MAQYVDGFVIPIKKKNVKEYKKMASVGCKVWIEHGALSYYETIGTHLKNSWGLSFSKLCKLKSDETVVFAFIVYKSKAHRDQVNKKVHKDPRMQPEKFPFQPFDMKRMTVGEFGVLVSKTK
ncbi:MAG: DUF1428 domain-containing protein [Bdellovibrionaceae bacterium]|nr:DUF1428 domain-containing protein [Pseudobdellovibrionaceae bacterium]